MRLKLAAQVSICDDAQQFVIFVHHGGTAQFARSHFQDGVFHAGILCYQRQFLALVHQVFDLENEFFAYATSGMEAGKIVERKVAAFEQSHGKSISQSQGDGSAGGGDHAQRLGIFGHAAIQRHVCRFSQSGLHIARESDDRRADKLQKWDNGNQLATRATIGNGDHQITLLDHAQVAMYAFSGMEEDGRRACAGQGGGYLSGDDTAFAHTREHHLALTISYQFKSSFHGFFVQAVCHLENGIRSRFERADDLCFDVHA